MPRVSASVLWCVLVVALTVPAAPVPAAPAPVVHVHSSSRYDRTPESLAFAARRYTRSLASLVTWTEVSAPRRADVLHRIPGWRSYTPRGTDLGVSWRRDTWELRHQSAPLLTRDTYETQHGGSAPLQHAAVVLLDRRADGLRMLVVVAHLPSGVQWGDGWRAAPQRARVWRQAVSTLAAFVPRARQRWHPDVVLMTADWNIDLRRHVWRARLRQSFPTLTPTWRPEHLPRGGTHAAGRLIDATLTNGHGRAWLLPDDASSDHRPYGERVYSPRHES